MKNNKKQHILSHSTKVVDIAYEDLVEDISSDLDVKIERLQNRRWRKVRKQQL